VKRIRESVVMEMELGGGIRDMETIDELVEMGIQRVILGTVAIEQPTLLEEACKKYPGKIIVGIDARDGKVAVKGWVETTATDAKSLAKEAERNRAAGIIYTDISTDGMMTGPNIRAMGEMVRTVNIPVIASGGVSSLDDIKKLQRIEGLWGVITGKAIYAGSLDLREAIKLVKSEE